MSNGGKPEKPDESDCCGNGCSPCVFDIYEQQLALWRNNQLTAAAVCNRADLLSNTRFKPFRLLDKCKISEDAFKFRFQPVVGNVLNIDQEQVISGVLPYSVGQHLVLRCFVRNPGGKNYADENLKFTDVSEFLNAGVAAVNNVEMLTRPYSPITIASREKNCVFEVFAKIYKSGKVSHYLKKSRVGDIFDWRGPYGDFNYQRNMYSHVLMICMGSGIAPMIPIAKSVLLDETDDTILHLMYGVKNVNHIILREELKDMTQFWNFTLEYYFSEEKELNLSLLFGEQSQNKQIDRKALSEYILGKNITNLLILLCGSDCFVSDMNHLISDVKLKFNYKVFNF